MKGVGHLYLSGCKGVPRMKCIYLQAELSLVGARLLSMIALLLIQTSSSLSLQLNCTYCHVAGIRVALSHAALPISICLKS